MRSELALRGLLRLGLALLVLSLAACGAVGPSGSGAVAPTPCPTEGLTATVRVGNSGGGGVAFHRVPDLDPSSHELSYPDETELRVVAAPIVGDGVTFAQVRAGNGVEGYLPVRYLVPEPASGCFIAPPVATPTPFPGRRAARVVRVRDAETLDLQVDGRTERARLIGAVMAPSTRPRDTIRCLADEAASAARSLLPAGVTIEIAADPTLAARDRAGSLLVYVWLPNGSLFNEELIRRGVLRESPPVAPYQLQRQLRTAEDEARAAARGVWSPGACGR